jgi:hypothetical protein
MWRRPREALEDRGEMRLRLKANVEGDLNQPGIWSMKQFLRTRDPSAKQVFVGTNTCRRAKLRSKMHGGETDSLGESGESDGAVEMGLDIVDRSPEPPFRQRRPSPPGGPRIARRRTYRCDSRPARTLDGNPQRIRDFSILGPVREIRSAAME